MMALALGLGVLGLFALRRARWRCYAGGDHGYGWHGPWAAHGCEDEGDAAGSRWSSGRRGRGRWGRRRGRWMLHAALARLDATPAQERAIVGEIDRLQERVDAARAGLHEVRTDLSAAVRGSVLDDAALGAVLGRVDGASSEVRAAALEALRGIHAVLDDGQRARLAELIDQGAGRGRGAWRTGPYR